MVIGRGARGGGESSSGALPGGTRKVHARLLPWSRRRVVTWSVGAAGSVGALKLAVRAAGDGGGANGGTAGGEWTGAVPSPSAAPRPITVALPEGDWYERYQSTGLVRRGVERVLPAVNAAAAGRFAVEPLAVAAPAAGRPGASQALGVAPLLATGAAPDLLAFTSRPSPGWTNDEFYAAAGLGFLGPLDDRLKGERALDLQEFSPAALEACRHRGQLLGVPLVAAPLQLLYDASRLDRAGLRRPGGAWGWRDLLDAARRLSRPNARTAEDQPDDGGDLGFVPGPPRSTLLSFIWQNGGDVVSADGKRSLLAEPAAVEAIAFAAEFFRGGRSADDALECAPLTEPSKWRFDAGGMRYADRWHVGMVYRPEPIWSLPAEWPLDATELPSGRRRATALAVTGTLSLNKRARDPAAAAAALALLTEHATRAVVPSPRRRPPEALLALEPRMTRAAAVALVNALSYARVLAVDDLARTTRLHEEVTNRLVGALQVPEYRRLGPREAAEAASAAVQQLLDRR